GQPGVGGDVHGVPLGHARVARPVPDPGPGGAVVGAAEEDRVRPPGDLGGDHQRSGVQRVDGEPGVAVVPVGDGGRADVGPGPGGDVVAPDFAGPAVVRPAGVAGRDEQVVALHHALVREVSGRLAGDPRPGAAAVAGHVDRVVLVRDA